MDLPLFDTHCHLADSAFHDDLPEIIERARLAGVSDILAIGLDVSNSLEAQSIADRWGFYFAAGIHPSDCGESTDNDFSSIREIANSPRCRAIGEIGLDFYHESNPPAEKQVSVFKSMLEIASEVNLPIVIHQRKSAEEVLKVLDLFKLPAGGIFHCFSGDWTYAEEVLRRGFHISIAGNITYKNSSLIETVQKTPIENLLIETDAPYLTPVPHRGKRNEPAYVAFTLARVAEIRNEPLEKIATQLFENSQRLLGSRPA